VMVYELIVMLAIAIGGASLGMILGAKNRWLILPFGLAAAICLRMVSYAITVVFGLQQYSAQLFFALIAAAAVIAIWRYRARLALPVVVSSAAAVLAWLLGRVLALKPQGHSDSSWILVMTHLFERGGHPELLEDKVPFKRGFDYPLMLALGPSNEYLSAFTPYIFIAIIAAIIWALAELLPNQSKLIAVYGSALGLVVLTATVPLRMITYINGHTLTALGVTLIAVVVVLAQRAQKLGKTEFAILLVSIATVSTTRPEGILVCVMALLPILASRYVTRVQLMLLASSATVSLAVWLNLYDSYILQKLAVPFWLFDLVLIGAGLLPWLKWFDGLRYRLVPIGLASMALVILAAQVFFFKGMQEGNIALFVNLFLGAGLWGYLFPFLLFVFIAVGYRQRSVDYKTLAIISLTLIMSFLIAKMLDGGQSGNPTLGRIGWSDSLNRMWIHLLPVLIITALVGLVERHRSLAEKVKI